MAMITEFKGLEGKKFKTILIDPPWRFKNRTGKIAPEHHRLSRYETMDMEELKELPVANHSEKNCHLYLWCPNALIPQGLELIEAWGFEYKTNLVWVKVTKDGKPDRRGVGFYYRNVTELLLFGVRGKLRTKDAARSHENVFASRKEEHSKKPAYVREIIEECSYGPYLELFARETAESWETWGDEVESYTEDRDVPKGYQNGGSRIEFGWK